MVDIQKPVLIIEDELGLLNAVRIKLAKENFPVLACTTAENAEEIMKDTQPALIWLDLFLPGMSGLEFLRKIRNDKKWEKLPVIVVSNSGSPEKIRESRELGVDTYFVKADWRLEEIIEVVRTILLSQK
ncbi:MAG: hypothetical protein A3A80_00890 [Candidatus Terrybacteria bacterium RIFCSPLOWO2_01_FULL_44_24]|uniref:Response regulatory domain-containing protein n=1 Tax=Candidatus Terrybacteria bacterium RIFCSPHIGHO2_01_FULL_43_35 TaxID=1802361 RepID=A0A1G2PF35_9BACT|nr:MAG: hypothetical protein A2828_02795 [Candidatus Terrybacteria bacterium RIFCSPHIGHO2_01_FULL_43_35]OHA51876.1 MAG: hypothetical protein A3A80_00890 [Candidatus Terrybacteria bacterium RIFCSPLOWO2_01_FULL_44_24]